MLGDIYSGLMLLLQPGVCLSLFLGVATGMAFGVLPGLGAASGTALFVAATYSFSNEIALAFLLGLYEAATYAGSITAIAIGIPGTASSASSVLDGYPMRLSGKLDRALSISVTAALFGGIMGTIALAFFTIPLANFAIRFGAPEYFALSLLGLAIISSLIEGGIVVGFILAAFGLLIKTIGLDNFTETERFTFDNPNLLDGIPLVSIYLGLFAIPQVLLLIRDLNKKKLIIPAAQKLKFFVFNLSVKKALFLFRSTLVSSLTGVFLGALPGVGAATATWLGYNEGKRFAHDKDKFGKGSEEGVAAAEAGANATVSAALIPLFAFGIPGSGTSAILMGALLLHGIVPGPTIFREHPELIYFVIITLTAGKLITMMFGVFGVGFWIRLIELPRAYIITTILTLAVIGAFSIRLNVFDVFLALGIGLFGYFIRCAGWSVVPIVLAVVLGGAIEENLRRSLIMSDSGLTYFLGRPVALVLLACAIITFFAPFFRLVRKVKSQSK